ncbi:hypothetical protein YEEN111655_07805 [Yersinia entomophaga]
MGAALEQARIAAFRQPKFDPAPNFHQACNVDQKRYLKPSAITINR